MMSWRLVIIAANIAVTLYSLKLFLVNPWTGLSFYIGGNLAMMMVIYFISKPIRNMVDLGAAMLFPLMGNSKFFQRQKKKGWIHERLARLIFFPAYVIFGIAMIPLSIVWGIYKIIKRRFKK